MILGHDAREGMIDRQLENAALACLLLQHEGVIGGVRSFLPIMKLP